MNTDSKLPETPALTKFVVIGGTGLIGAQVVTSLRGLGHEVVVASRSSGVDTITGAGLAEALSGAQVVVDVANSPSFEAVAVKKFFETAGRNIAAAEKASGVKHHVALSVVGTDRAPGNGYFAAKLAQETLIKDSGIPYTIVRATQFFEFTGAIAQTAMVGTAVRVSSAMMQPIAAADVAAAVTEAALAAPRNGIVEVAGPEPIRMDELVRQFLAAHHDAREIVTDDAAGYFGAPVDDHSLTPGANPKLGRTHFADWLRQSISTK